MNPQSVQDLVEAALERSIEALNVLATDKALDRELRETQAMCNHALEELRGFGHEIPKEEWHNSDHGE